VAKNSRFQRNKADRHNSFGCFLLTFGYIIPMENGAVFKIGVISDTHGELDPKVQGIFAGVNHILHAGDIGLPWLILKLEEIAPVTAVMGATMAIAPVESPR